MLHRVVVARDGACVVEGYGECGGHLQTAHILPKGKYPALRYHLKNVVCMCWRHHMHWWHKNPLEAAEWFQRTRTEQWGVLVMLRSQQQKVDRKKDQLYLESLEV